MLSGGQKFLRILKYALNQNFKMQVSARGSARRTHFSNFLATFDQVALFDKHPGGMGVTRDEIIAVINFHHVAVVRVILLRYHHTASGCQDRSAWCSGEIQPGMQGSQSIQRINAPAKRRP